MCAHHPRSVQQWEGGQSEVRVTVLCFPTLHAWKPQVSPLGPNPHIRYSRPGTESKHKSGRGVGQQGEL